MGLPIDAISQGLYKTYMGLPIDAISQRNTKHKWACLLTQFPKDRQYTTYNLLVTEMKFVSWPASRISCLDTTRPD